MNYPQHNKSRKIAVIVLSSIMLATPSFGKCLKGDCDNGQGTASLAGVKTFTGSFVNGQPVGAGTLVYNGKYHISGEFTGWTPTGVKQVVCPDKSEHQLDFSTLPKQSPVTRVKDLCDPKEDVYVDKEEEERIKQKLADMDKQSKLEAANKAVAARRRAAARKVYTNDYSGQPSSQSTSGGITARCAEKWGNNYEMIEYCIKNQTEAKQQVSRRQSTGVKSRCQEKWGTNYEMVEYCIKNQSGAKDRLGM